MSDRKHIVVIGGGIVGVCCALALVRSGHRVTVIEPGEPGGTQAASHGNGGFLSPASIIPMSMPGVWKKVPGYLLDSRGPLTIRWRHLPGLTPWLIRFLLAGISLPRVRRTAAALWSLVGDAPDRHAAVAESCGCAELVHRDGLLYAYPDRAAFEEEATSWKLRRENGLEWREIETEELRRLEPALSTAYSFAALVESGAHCGDPGGYVAAIAGQAAREGATVLRASAQAFEFSGDRLKGVRTTAGSIACDGAVLAAGIASKRLAETAGDAIPLESERGYFVELHAPAIRLRRPVLPSDGKMANVMTAGGLRASGQVELATATAEPDWRRADILLYHLRRTYPALAETADMAEASTWYGHRPSTPDGLPVISHSARSKDVVYAFGHGHVGLSSAPRTAELVTSLVDRIPATADLTPFRASRFR